MHGHDVKAIREGIGKNQAEFARQFRINLHTLRQWERKNTQLDSAAAAYITCIVADADAMLRCLHKSQECLESAKAAKVSKSTKSDRR